MRIQNKILIFLSLLGFLAFSNVLPARAENESQAWRVNDYSIYLRPVPNTYDVKLQEDLQVHFSEEKRGIIRAIPYNSQPIDWEQSPLYYESATVTDFNDQALPFVDYHEYDYFNVRIGDSEVYLLGPQNYRLNFDISNGMWRYFSDYAEIYWNAIGNEWPVYIDKSQVIVDFSAWDLDWSQVEAICYTGVYGSQEQDCAVLKDDQKKQITIKTLKTLWPYEGLTFAVRVPLSAVPKPPAFELVPNAQMQVNDFRATLRPVPESQSVLVQESFNALYREPRERLTVQFYNYWDEEAGKRNFLFLENGESNHSLAFVKAADSSYYNAAGLMYLNHEASKDERYDFSYQISHGAWYWKNQRAHLTWELINYDWMALTDGAEVTVDLKDWNIPSEEVAVACYTTEYGEYDPCVIEKSADQVKLTLNRRLMPEEILMLKLSVPEKYVPQSIPVLLWLKIYWPLGLLLLLSVLAIVAVWRWRAGLRQERAVLAQYDSVDDLPPSATAMINSHSWKDDYWTAEIIYFATRKYLKIENRAKTEEASDQYVLKLLKTDYKNDVNLSQYQKDLLAMLFEEGKTELDLSTVKSWSSVKQELMYKNFLKLRTDVKSGLEEKDYFKKSYAGGFSIFFSVVLLYFAFWFLVPWWQAFYTLPLADHFSNPYTYLGLILPLLIIYWRFRVFFPKPAVKTQPSDDAPVIVGKSWQRNGAWVFAALMMFAVAATTARAFLPSSYEMILFMVLVFLALFVLFAVPYWLIFTDKGVDAYWHNLGLIDYLKTAEAERFKFGELTDLFEKLLPYAIAFGFLKKWAELMKEMYKQPPDWLNDQRGLDRSLAGLTSLASAAKALNRAVSAGRAAGAARRYGSGGTSYRSGGSSGGSSGFSSGGGFSGGGSGGGGGRSW